MLCNWWAGRPMRTFRIAPRSPNQSLGISSHRSAATRAPRGRVLQFANCAASARDAYGALVPRSRVPTA
jgi:hypothetical protein